MDEALELRRLRGSVFVEVLGAIAVIVVTALLVNVVPAKTALGQETFGASDVTLKSSKVWIDVATSPGIAGVNDVHVSALTPDGAPLKLAELTVTVDLPGKRSRRSTCRCATSAWATTCRPGSTSRSAVTGGSPLRRLDDSTR